MHDFNYYVLHSVLRVFFQHFFFLLVTVLKQELQCLFSIIAFSLQLLESPTQLLFWVFLLFSFFILFYFDSICRSGCLLPRTETRMEITQFLFFFSHFKKKANKNQLLLKEKKRNDRSNKNYFPSPSSLYIWDVISSSNVILSTLTSSKGTIISILHRLHSQIHVHGNTHTDTIHDKVITSIHNDWHAKPPSPSPAALRRRPTCLLRQPNRQRRQHHYQQ